MTTPSSKKTLCFLWRIPIFSLLILRALALNSDGTLLLAFKNSILSDPLSVLGNWNYFDQTPCYWTGVTCAQMGTSPDSSRVVSLALPGNKLLGSIPLDIGFIEHLQQLDLSNNYINGTLPVALFNASELRVLSLANNVISGQLPETIGGLKSLTTLNLSENAFGGVLPRDLSSMHNLTVVSLKGNYFSGNVPSGFNSAQVLDFSSNLFNGTLPSVLGGWGLRYANLSYNNLSGKLPPGFASQVPENSTIDLSFNNLTGQIPDQKPLLNQKPEAFDGNPELCGKPLRNQCTIPSTLSTAPNVATSIPPAIAVIPKTIGTDISSNISSAHGKTANRTSSLRPAIIVGIILADIAGICFIAVAILYLYNLRTRKNKPIDPREHKQQQKQKQNQNQNQNANANANPAIKDQFSSSSQNNNDPTTIKSPNNSSCCCLKSVIDGASTASESRESTSCSEDNWSERGHGLNMNKKRSKGTSGKLVMVDGETELELETLLKASAYVLGASGSSIVYKAVVHDGTTFAVRRLGQSGVERMKDFESQVRAIAKLRHPNLVKVRGFYWGSNEKLLILDYVSNGSLASTSTKKAGSSPAHIPLEVRLRIARGLARGLAYTHEKKLVHGNIKPSNILLTPEMEPIITDLGLSWLAYGRGAGSGRQTDTKISMGSNDMVQEVRSSSSPYMNPAAGGSNVAASPYQAPESMRNLKPNQKWDVYSFGIVLLELLTGKVLMDQDLAQWAHGDGLKDRNWASKMTDVGIRGEIQGREEDIVGIFKLGFSCASLVPQMRPTIKEALQVLERSPVLQM